MNTFYTSLNLKPFSTKPGAAHCDTEIQTKTEQSAHFSMARLQEYFKVFLSILKLQILMRAFHAVLI